MINATDLVETLLQADEPVGRTNLGEPRALLRFGIGRTATEIVNRLLEAQPAGGVPVFEASVHRPKRSQIWQAVFTGPAGGQTWRSTGLADRTQALLVAKQWEREARAERARLGRAAKKPVWRVRRTEPGSGIGLTQKEVALLLNLSERAVREIEHRALRKIRSHPLMREVWRQYLAGELDEAQLILTPAEIQALFNLASSTEERRLLQKVLALIHA
ncbi:MAG: sigma factor-like helix-turn-helix DNA-binding protein [Limisphaerales bacterium]